MLEDFRNGDRDLKERLNELLAAARKINRMSGDEHIKVRHTANDISISMERMPKPKPSASGSISRIAYCKYNADNSSTIDCYLDTDLTGDLVTVTCLINGGNRLDRAVPFLALGDSIIVTSISGSWHCVTNFAAAEEYTT